MTILLWPLVIALGYLFGNVEWGLVISRLFHIDIRQHGSGNSGATNVTRTLGAAPGLLTLLGDAGKGVLASLLGLLLLGREGAMVAGLCAVIGHNWPIFLGFKGGKGVAASVGTVLVVEPLLGGCATAIAVAVIAVTRYVSLGSLTGVTLLVLAVLLFKFGDWPLLLYTAVLAVMIWYVHRGNIERLLARRENKLTFGKR